MPSGATDGVSLVDKIDGRGVLAGLLQKVSHPDGTTIMSEHSAALIEWNGTSAALAAGRGR
jgi:hypothetical protein